jgi:hypothetical protein
MTSNNASNGTEIYEVTPAAQLQDKIAERFKKLGVPLATSGWPGRIDSGLTTAPELTKASLDALIASWSPRWTDTLYQDLRSSIVALENDARYYSDLNYRLANYVIEQFAQDGELDIHNLEVQAGWLTVASEVATTDAAAQQSIADGLADSAKLYTQMLQDSTVAMGLNNPALLASKRAASATVSSLTPYQLVYDDSSKKGYVTYNESVLDGDVPVVQPGGPGLHVGAIAAIYSNAVDSFSFDALVNSTSAHPRRGWHRPTPSLQQTAWPPKPGRRLGRLPTIIPSGAESLDKRTAGSSGPRVAVRGWYGRLFLR